MCLLICIKKTRLCLNLLKNLQNRSNNWKRTFRKRNRKSKCITQKEPVLMGREEKLKLYYSFKQTLMNKIQQEEKRKQILKIQYEKSLETIGLIKSYLENVFVAIDIEPDIIEKLRMSAITEENMIYFLGKLEEKGNLIKLKESRQFLIMLN